MVMMRYNCMIAIVAALLARTASFAQLTVETLTTVGSGDYEWSDHVFRLGASAEVAYSLPFVVTMRGESKASLADCKSYCLNDTGWICVGVVYTPSAICHPLTSMYRMRASSIDRFFKRTTIENHNKYPGLVAEPSSENYATHLSDYPLATMLFLNEDWVVSSVSDETHPYLGLRPNASFIESMLYDDDSLRTDTTAYISFVSSRAPDPLALPVPSPSPFTYYFDVDIDFDSTEGNAVIMDIELLPNSTDCSDTCQKLFFPYENVCMGYLELDGSVCRILTDIAKLAGMATYTDFSISFFNTLHQHFTDLTIIPSNDFTPKTLPSALSPWKMYNKTSYFRFMNYVDGSLSYPLYVRDDYASEYFAVADYTFLFSIDCSENAESGGVTSNDFCTAGLNTIASSPFVSGVTIEVPTPTGGTWTQGRCRTMCRFNADFCLGYNLYDNTCELLSDSNLVSGGSDLQWPQSLSDIDCRDATAFSSCTSAQVQPYRLTTRGVSSDISEFATTTCRATLKYVREGNCAGSLRDDYVYRLSAPTSNSEVFDICSSICCQEDDWCAGIEYTTRTANSLYKQCDFLIREDATMRSSDYKEVSWNSRTIVLIQADRKLISNTDDESIVCVTKPGIANPYLDPASPFVYSGGSSCASASGYSPIQATLSTAIDTTEDDYVNMTVLDKDDAKLSYCRDYCDSRDDVCKGFTVHFLDRAAASFQCVMYTSIAAFAKYDYSSFVTLWRQTVNKGLAGALEPLVYVDVNDRWNVTGMYGFYTHPERDTWNIEADSYENLDQSICYSRYDYLSLFSSSSGSFETLSNRRCDASTSYVLRHQTALTDTEARELCQNICADNDSICRGYMIQDDTDCVLFVDWESVSIDTDILETLAGMSSVESTLLSNFRFIKECSSSEDAKCEAVSQSRTAISTGVLSDGSICYVNPNYSTPDTESVQNVLKIVLISVGSGLGLCILIYIIFQEKSERDRTVLYVNR